MLRLGMAIKLPVGRKLSMVVPFAIPWETTSGRWFYDVANGGISIINWSISVVLGENLHVFPKFEI